jgi:hypothetical protein
MRGEVVIICGLRTVSLASVDEYSSLELWFIERLTCQLIYRNLSAMEKIPSDQKIKSID